MIRLERKQKIWIGLKDPTYWIFSAAEMVSNWVVTNVFTRKVFVGGWMDQRLLQRLSAASNKY